MMVTKPAPATDAPRPIPTTVPVLKRLPLRGSQSEHFGPPEDMESWEMLTGAPWVESASAVGKADAPAVGVLDDADVFDTMAAELVELAGALSDDAEVGSVDGTVTSLVPGLLLEETAAAGGGVDEEEGVAIVEEEGDGVDEEVGVGVDGEEGVGADEEEGVRVDVEERLVIDEEVDEVVTDCSAGVRTDEDDFEDELVVTDSGAAHGTDKDELEEELLCEDAGQPCCGLRAGLFGEGTAFSLKVTAPGVSQHFARSSAKPQQ